MLGLTVKENGGLDQILYQLSFARYLSESVFGETIFDHNVILFDDVGSLWEEFQDYIGIVDRWLW